MQMLSLITLVESVLRSYTDHVLLLLGNASLFATNP